MHFLLQVFVLTGLPLVWATAVDVPQKQQSFAFHTNILNPDIDAAIHSILKDFNAPGGVGVAVVRKGKEGLDWKVETKGYGIAKVDGTKVTEDTLFPIGSNSKLFDILATGLLISNESLSTRISWDTKIVSVVPGWGLMDPVASAGSTIRDLMSHRTGLPRHGFMRPLDTISETIQRLRYLKPSTGFRELYQYNNHMYTLLSYFPQLLIGVSFEKYVNDFIIEPLGMNSTTYFSERAERSGQLADGMMRDGVNQTEDLFGVGRVRALPFWNPTKENTGNVFSGAGGLISSANDIATWLQALLSEGRHPTNNKTIIPAEVIREVAAGVVVGLPVAPFPELSPIVYGGAQSRGSYRGFEFIEHGGNVPGFSSQIIRFPLQNFGVAVLSNDESFGDEIMETIKFRLIDEILKLEVIDWSGRLKSLAASAYAHRTVPTHRPANATLPSSPFQSLAGTYRDPGYGTLDLCLVSPKGDSLTSKSCRELLQEIPTVLPNTLNLEIPTLLARWKGYRVTHISLQHFEHNTFNFTWLFSIPTGNSSERPYWVKVDSKPSFVAEFSCGGTLGVGLRGLWGAGEEMHNPRGENAKERAEVWFEKIHEV